MNIGLLGSGAECDAAYRSLVDAGHVVTHAGPSVRSGCRHIVDHHQALAEGVHDILLVSYGPLIETALLDKARFYNVHNALLPRFRGFHGLVWSIINGEPEVGFTLHRVDDGIDSGPIHHQHRMPLGATDTIGDVRARIEDAIRADLGLAFTRIEQGQQPSPQDDSQATVVAKRGPDDGVIDWNWPAVRVFDLIRAIAPPTYSGAFTTFHDERLVIRQARMLPNPPFIATPGRVVNFSGNSVWVMCGDRLLQLDELEFRGRIGPARSFFTRVGARLGATRSDS